MDADSPLSGTLAGDPVRLFLGCLTPNVLRCGVIVGVLFLPFDLLAKTTTTTAHTTPPIITSQIHPMSPDDVDVGGGIFDVDVDDDDDVTVKDCVRLLDGFH